jgi:hypothetical protein
LQRHHLVSGKSLQIIAVDVRSREDETIEDVFRSSPSVAQMVTAIRRSSVTAMTAAPITGRRPFASRQMAAQSTLAITH